MKYTRVYLVGGSDGWRVLGRFTRKQARELARKGGVNLWELEWTREAISVAGK